MNNAEVIVIGAGIVGAACADALSERGLRVAVIEQDIAGGGATAAGMGHLVVMDDNAAELALSAYSLSLWKDLVGDRPQRHEYSGCGTIWVAADEEEMEAALVKAQTLCGHGLLCEVLTPAALYAREPQLRAGLAGGLLVRGDGLVYPPKTTRILLDRAMRRGAITKRAQVTAIEDHAVVLGDGTRHQAQHIVLAAGVRSSVLLPELPIQAKKGHLAITDRYPGFVKHQLVELGYIKSAHAASGDSVAFNLQPRPTGQILIGSSRQFDTIDPAVEPAMLQRMLRHAASFTPQLKELNVLRTWTGFRAATPDGLPLIGPSSARRGLWLATGHEGLGITTSLATAQLLAGQIQKEKPASPMCPICQDASMDDGKITLCINAQSVSVEPGVTVAAAIAMAGSGVTRRSVSGATRAPLCGMGICQECRVMINGRPHQLSCQTLCADGMHVVTAGEVQP